MRRVIVVLIAAAAVALPANAPAATFCVAKPSCAGSDQPDVPAALAAARSNQEDDRIEIGPGTFVPDPSGVIFSDEADHSLEIVGAGQGRTILTAPPLGGVPYAFHTLALFGDARIASLTVRGGDSSVASIGLLLAGDHNELDRVTVADPPGSEPILHVAVEASEGTTIRSSHLAVGAGFWRRALSAGAAGQSSPVRVENSTLSGHAPVSTGAPITIARSRLTTTGDHSAAVSAGRQALVEDSTVVISGEGASGVRGYGDAQIALDGVTIVGGAGHTGVEASNAKATVTNSIVHGVERAFSASGDGASIAPSYTNYAFAAVDGAVLPGPGNLDAVDPQFGDDYALRADSPLIDAGDPAARATRAIDGNGDGAAVVDLGAFEFDPAAAGPELLTRSARATRRGAARLALRCPAAAISACRGTVALAAGGAKLGSAGFRIAPGATAAYSVKLHKAARRALERRGSLRAEAVVTGDRRAPRRFAIKLLRPR